MNLERERGSGYKERKKERERENETDWHFETGGDKLNDILTIFTCNFLVHL